MLVNTPGLYFNVGHTSTTGLPVSSENVLGIQWVRGRPYCSVVLDIRHCFIEYLVYDLDNGEVFFKGDSKRLEVAFR